MRELFLLVISLLFFNINPKCQESIAIKSGISMSAINDIRNPFPNTFSNNKQIGKHIKFEYLKSINKMINIGGSINYSNKRFSARDTYSSTYINGKINLSFIYINFTTSIKIDKKGNLRFIVSPYFGSRIAGNVDVTQIWGDYRETYYRKINENADIFYLYLDFGICTGICYEFKINSSNKILLDYSIETGINNIGVRNSRYLPNTNIFSHKISTGIIHLF